MKIVDSAPTLKTTVVSFSGGTSVQEYLNGSLEVEYLRGSDLGGGIGGLLYSLRGGTPSYTHYNARGDVVAKTDGGNALTYQATYEAFGTRPEEVGSTADKQKANTKDEDPTGLLNEGFRYRDLETGVFITRDPIGFADGPNLYAYVHQNPWTKFDPEGLADDDPNKKKPDFLKRVGDTIGHFFNGTLGKHGKDSDQPSSSASKTRQTATETRARAANKAAGGQNAAATEGGDVGQRGDVHDQMAQHIVNSEARRDKAGNLRVYQPPGNDGGGAFEVAGINDTYDHNTAVHLRGLIEGGHPREAEIQARNYIRNYTEPAGGWAHNPGVEFYLRDSAFNRGVGGAGQIARMALGMPRKGGMTGEARAALTAAEQDPHQFLGRLRSARERYEDIVAPGRPNLRRGLINRWNSALRYSEQLNAENR